MNLLFALGKTTVGRMWLASCVATVGLGWYAMRVGPHSMHPERLLWAVSLPAAVLAGTHMELTRRAWLSAPARPALWSRIMRAGAWAFWSVGVAAAAFIFGVLWWRLLRSAWQ